MAVGCRILIFPAEARSLSPCSLLTLREGQPPPAPFRLALRTSNRLAARRPRAVLKPICLRPSAPHYRRPGVCHPLFFCHSCSYKLSLTPPSPPSLSPCEALSSHFYYGVLLALQHRPAPPYRTTAQQARAAAPHALLHAPPRPLLLAGPAGSVISLAAAAACLRQGPPLFPGETRPALRLCGADWLPGLSFTVWAAVRLGERGRAGCPLRACAVRARAGSGKGLGRDWCIPSHLSCLLFLLSQQAPV